MQRSLLCLLFAFSAALTMSAQQARDIGTVEVSADNRTLPVRVSGATAELNQLAFMAFGAHGRYRIDSSGYRYDIRFSPAGGNSVRVDVTQRFGGQVASEVASGATLRQAFFAAADMAVQKTNGMGLRGFFTSRLVFIGKRTGHSEVYTSDLFFGDVHQITHDNAIALDPRWSPDGSRVLYTSYFHSGFPDIFQIDLGGYQRTTFVSFKGTNSGARFSPDGSRVAMVLSGEGEPEVYVSDANGRQVSRRTHSDLVKASPCWSPDGSRIVFAMEPGPQLYVISASGGAAQRISFNTSRYCAEPDWSRTNPDKIAFTMGVGRNYQIGVLSVSSHSAEQVSHAAFDGVEPSWLPDGRHLVYTARTASQSRICILDTETGKSTPVSPNSFGPVQQASVWGR